MSTDLIAEAVRESRDRVLAADPECYRGFATDAAIRAVAKREGLGWRIVHRAYRDHYRAAKLTNWRGFRNGRQPSEDARALA